MPCETCHDMTCHDDLNIRYMRWEVGGTRARRADDRGSWDSDGGSWGSNYLGPSHPSISVNTYRRHLQHVPGEGGR